MIDVTGRARLAPSLAQLRDEVDRLWPERSKASDGWLGDAAHRTRSSDHNPDAEGIVRALDITSRGVDLQRLVVDVSHHRACWYVISHGILYSQTHGFVGVLYHGVDPHVSHLHVSIRRTDWAASTKRPWLSPRE